MIARRGLALAAALAALAHPAAARDVCLTSVDDGGVLTALEHEQPWRIVDPPSRTALPGYPNLIFFRMDASGKAAAHGWQIAGNRLEPLAGPFPQIGAYSVPVAWPRPDGSVIGVYAPLGATETIYRRAPGATAFEPLRRLGRGEYLSRDPGSDRLLIATRDGYFDFDAAPGAPPVLPPLPVTEPGGNPRFVFDLGGWLAIYGDGLWFIPEGGRAWTRIGHATEKLYGLERAEPKRLAPGIVAIDLDGDVFVLERRAAGVRLRNYWRAERSAMIGGPEGDLVIWGYEPSPRGLLGRLFASGPDPADLPSRVTLAGAEPLPGDATPPPSAGGRHFPVSHGGLIAAPGRRDAWFLAEHGLAYFDGTLMHRLPDNDVPPWLWGAVYAGGSWVLISQQDLYRVGPDLKPQRIGAPFGTDKGRYIEVKPVPSLGGYLILGNAASGIQAVFTADMAHFQPVTGAPAHSLSFVAELPGRPAALLAAREGLVIAEPCAE